MCALFVCICTYKKAVTGGIGACLQGKIRVLRLAQQTESGGAMVVLQRGCVIVGDGQRVPRLDQEVIVDPSMLVVVHQGGPVCRHMLPGV